jgi:hypothetical protein
VKKGKKNTVFRAAHNLAVAPLSESKLQPQRSWGALGEFLERNNHAIGPLKPLPQHWTNFSFWGSGMCTLPQQASKRTVQSASAK